MTARITLTGLCAAALSLALGSAALAGPAGSEYLPKIPQSGAHSTSAGTQPTETSTTPQGTIGSGGKSGKEHRKKSKGKKVSDQTMPVASSESGGSGGSGGSSGSILLDPVVLLMIAGVIVIAIGMTLRRRKTRSLEYLAEQQRESNPVRNARPTPKGEIIGSGDKAP